MFLERLCFTLFHLSFQCLTSALLTSALSFLLSGYTRCVTWLLYTLVNFFGCINMKRPIPFHLFGISLSMWSMKDKMKWENLPFPGRSFLSILHMGPRWKGKASLTLLNLIPRRQDETGHPFPSGSIEYLHKRDDCPSPSCRWYQDEWSLSIFYPGHLVYERQDEKRQNPPFHIGKLYLLNSGLWKTR